VQHAGIVARPPKAALTMRTAALNVGAPGPGRQAP
jgi:hypothetical protein